MKIAKFYLLALITFFLVSCVSNEDRQSQVTSAYFHGVGTANYPDNAFPMGWLTFQEAVAPSIGQFVDFFAPAGTPVYASEHGKVLAIEPPQRGRQGAFVRIFANTKTEPHYIEYENIENLNVKVKEPVRAGQLIGVVGKSDSYIASRNYREEKTDIFGLSSELGFLRVAVRAGPSKPNGLLVSPKVAASFFVAPKRKSIECVDTERGKLRPQAGGYSRGRFYSIATGKEDRPLFLYPVACNDSARSFKLPDWIVAK